jgi:hypothetical protein
MARKTIVVYCRFGHETGAEAAILMRFSADAALYAAKSAGRNRVECLEPDTEDLLPELKATVRAADPKSLGELTPRPWRKRRA